LIDFEEEKEDKEKQKKSRTGEKKKTTHSECGREKGSRVIQIVVVIHVV
jgi:hypothetical protein